MVSKSKKKKPVEDMIKTWVGLNDILRDATEKLCQKLLIAEKSGRKRKQFLLRIHSRLNRMRRDRERKEL